MRLLAYYEAQEGLMYAEAHNRGRKIRKYTRRDTFELWKSLDKLQRSYIFIGLGCVATVSTIFRFLSNLTELRHIIFQPPLWLTQFVTGSVWGCRAS